jgi:hypothetical protein
MLQVVQLHQEILEESQRLQIEILDQVLLAPLLGVKAEVVLVAEEDHLLAPPQAHLAEEEDNSILKLL